MSVSSVGSSSPSFHSEPGGATQSSSLPKPVEASAKKEASSESSSSRAKPREEAKSNSVFEEVKAGKKKLAEA